MDNRKKLSRSKPKQNRKLRIQINSKNMGEKMNQGHKLISVQNSTAESLNRLKELKGYSSLNATILYLLGRFEEESKQKVIE